MMWFFAILVVLVMGAVAALGAGRGTPMAPSHGDRPDALVPREGPLRATDVRRVQFSLAFRGYRMDEVDALLDRVAAQLELAEATEPAEHPAEPAAGPPTDSVAEPVEPGGVAEPVTGAGEVAERQDEVAGRPSVSEVRGDDPRT
jgi:DivIVA domain-containing protein